MSLFRRTAGYPHQKPDDSPDLSWMMAFVTSVGGASAYSSKRSMAGLVAGCGLGALFGISGLMIQTEKPSQHEMAHQIALLGSVMFAGGMGYRAGANPYVGPGGAMLAALGALSSTYHLVKWLEWRAYEAARMAEAERLLREHYRSLASGGASGGGAPDAGQGGGALGPPLGSAAGRSHSHGGALPGGLPGGPPPPPGWR